MSNESNKKELKYWFVYPNGDMLSKSHGEDQRPVFGDIVKGSALLRSAVPPDANPTVRLRLVEAKLDPETNPGKHAGNIGKLMERDNTRGQVEDRNGAVILEFSPKAKTAEV